jgi:hypothetical protein
MARIRACTALSHHWPHAVMNLTKANSGWKSQFSAFPYAIVVLVAVVAVPRDVLQAQPEPSTRTDSPLPELPSDKKRMCNTARAL